MTFTLAGQGETLTAVTKQDGTAAFIGIGTGVYRLAETAAASCHSKAYLHPYFQSAYGTGHQYASYRLADFASKGIFLGFETELKDNQMVVSNIVDLKDYGLDDLLLEVVNPELCELILQKTDNIETDVYKRQRQGRLAGHGRDGKSRTAGEPEPCLDAYSGGNLQLFGISTDAFR